jgi:hypothetical protein
MCPAYPSCLCCAGRLDLRKKALPIRPLLNRRRNRHSAVFGAPHHRHVGRPVPIKFPFLIISES